MKFTQANALVIAQLILFAALFITFLVFPVNRELPIAIRLLAALMMVTGLGFVVLSFREHSRTNTEMLRISPEPNNRARLVETGVYKAIRHPIYTGAIIGAVGAALLHGHPVPIVLSILFVPFFTYKSGFEEKLLRKTYPQYGEYMQRTGRFTPWV